MIAITFALPAESSGLVRLLQDPRELHAHGDKLFSGEIGHRPVTIFHTGVGHKSCQAKIDRFLEKRRPQFVISTGFAGAVREDLNIGDLVFGENFSDGALLLRAKQVLRNRNPRAVRLFTSSSIVNSIEQRSEIAQVSEAAAVDMETEFIAAACNAHGVPLLSLRAISDTPNNPFPAPPSVLFDIERQRPNPGRLVSYLATHPQRILRLVQFSRRIAHCRKILTTTIVDLLRGM
jgi:adenosylhomocysteine nucleosidase